jgi:predicted DNA-binding transcriptional regulator AlpA
MTLPYPPPYQDLATLAEHICAGESTIENWVRLGLFPEPKKIGGKRLWSWREVERHLVKREREPDPLAERVRNAAREIVSKDH